MRTLTRPMFNWGGPVKAGIMHGIREPYKGGGAALVGNPVYPQTGGREHHNIWLAAGQGVGRALPHIRRAGQAFKNIFGRNVPQGVGTTTIGGKTFQTVGTGGKWQPNWLGRDPVVGATRWGYGALTNPAAKGLGKKALRIATSPSTLVGGAIYGFWPDGTPKEPPKTGGPPGGGDRGMTYTSPEKEIKVLSDAERKAFANKQRNERVQKYLDMMGYDRSKKTAIADALIDASKIVSDRGTLDRKNITAELINPAIQAFSKRLDKPEQIREAVGLMATKAEIEKDLSKERDALDTKLKKLKIETGEKALEATESFEGGLRAFLSERKGTVDKTTLERIARLLANEHKETFTKVTEDTDITTLDDGIYMSEGKIIRMTDGVPTQIV
jgi:hypothetical protein